MFNTWLGDSGTDQCFLGVTTQQHPTYWTHTRTTVHTDEAWGSSGCGAIAGVGQDAVGSADAAVALSPRLATTTEPSTLPALEVAAHGAITGQDAGDIAWARLV